MKARFYFMILCVIFVFGHVQTSVADPGTQPNGPCPTNGAVVLSGGAESGGNGSMMVCQGGTWKAIMSFDGGGHILRFGQHACGNGEVLSYNNSQWHCAPRGQLECATVNAANCPAGFMKTGYTPDILLGLGSYPVCCRVQ